ncbi:hypothetical protein G3N56_13585 [Desulfovibrio sulfodismutans]|uniref:DUF5610 domain-containing protein n=1 Tax=Desulfolutivibrio sulfodismutans TaxID=63561 RepID=A0A7K3NPJ8_9BACT|nr:hypothetical protein [Desulfolutivibrio sulfodismutans]NDY57763.1 hypothetical protein [Desulfolutivibrio sulfodismutans]QLA13349.1 hypothetical protein GD606_14305 [Desulfolutivibrio sulfodismutans DSM 3696]
MYIDTLSLSLGTSMLTGGATGRSGTSSGRGATLAVSQTSIGREEIETFAAEIRRRADLGVSTTDADQTGDAESTDSKGAALAASLADAVDFIREEYGSDAATATMGLVLQNVGDGALTEENLSDGLVAALKFIDRNLGTAAGDRVISKFNGSLNDSMNRYFENGHEELFVAVENGVASTGAAASAALTLETVADSDDEDSQSAEDGILAMLKEISIQRDAENASTGGDAAVADPYAAYTASSLQTSGMLLNTSI